MHFTSDAHRSKDRTWYGLRATLLAAVPAALLLALALALILPSTASAGLRALKFGAHVQTAIPGDLDAWDAANVATVRTPFLWHRIEQSRASRHRCNATYDWSYYDALVAFSSRRNVRILPIIIGSPSYASKRAANAPTTRSPAMHDYECFVRALANRYGRGGVLPRRVSGVKPIGAWQVWNEPNLPAFAARWRVNPREYARFLKATHRELTRADRRAKVILGGMPEGTRHVSLTDFLNQMYRVRKVKRAFDAVAIHPYSDNWRGVKGALGRLRQQLNRLGDRRTPIWITEIGWATDGQLADDGQKIFTVKSPRGQARQLRRTFKMLRRNARRYQLGTVIWFRWRDVEQVGGKKWQDHAGLYYKDGRPKPACGAFTSFTSGFCRNIVVASPQEPPPEPDPTLSPGVSATGIEPSPPPGG